MGNRKLHISGIITLIFVSFICVRQLHVINSAKIAVIFVPHHDLVAEQRLNFLQKIQPKIKDKPLILLSTNHYDAGANDLQTRKSDFTTRNGTITVNQKLYSTALALGAQDEPITFEAEHGVSSLLPDIAKLFPNSSILPLVIKPSIDNQKLEMTIADLHSACPECIVIASVDFSHYQPYQLSEFHDKQTLRTLLSFTIDDAILQKREVGEPHVLWAAMRWAELSETKKFQLLDHTNSTAIINDLDSEGTTHIFGYYQTGTPRTLKESVSFSIAGTIDFMHKPTLDAFQSLGERIFWGTDATIASTENSQLASQRILEFLHIDTQLEKPAEKYDIKGDGATIHVRTIAEDTFKDKSDNQICSDACYEIAYIYWNKSSDQQQRKSIALHLIDNGADLVLGNSTTLTPVDRYNDRPIIYGLGGQLAHSKEAGLSMTLSGEFTDNKLLLLPMLIDSSNGKAILQRTEQSRQLLKNYYGAFSEELVDDRGGLLFSIGLH